MCVKKSSCNNEFLSLLLVEYVWVILGVICMWMLGRNKMVMDVFDDFVKS